MQLAISDMVLINKADLADTAQIDAIMEIVKGQKPERPVFVTRFGRFEREWLETMDRPAEAGAQEIHTRDITLQKLTLCVGGFDEKSLTAFLKMFAEDTYRIKGFVSLTEGVFLVSCVGPIVELLPFDGDTPELNRLAVLYGNGLPAKKSIREAVSWFPEQEIVLS